MNLKNLILMGWVSLGLTSCSSCRTAATGNLTATLKSDLTVKIDSISSSRDGFDLKLSLFSQTDCELRVGGGESIWFDVSEVIYGEAKQLLPIVYMEQGSDISEDYIEKNLPKNSTITSEVRFLTAMGINDSRRAVPGSKYLFTESQMEDRPILARNRSNFIVNVWWLLQTKEGKFFSIASDDKLHVVISELGDMAMTVND